MKNFLEKVIHKKKPKPVIRETTYIPPIADDAYSAPEGARLGVILVPSDKPPKMAGKPGYEYNADDPFDIPPWLRR